MTPLYHAPCTQDSGDRAHTADEKRAGHGTWLPFISQTPPGLSHLAPLARVINSRPIREPHASQSLVLGALRRRAVLVGMSTGGNACSVKAVTPPVTMLLRRDSRIVRRAIFWATGGLYSGVGPAITVILAWPLPRFLHAQAVQNTSAGEKVVPDPGFPLLYLLRHPTHH